ncbi:hypothetical protein FACS1894166_04500 [Bacilli bacterium]|nr:hypothetical protein FACS1894166_04500 [Bacilli bacterium]
MELINLKPDTVIEKSKRPLVIGFFDGLHQGHKTLFAGLKTGQYDILTFVHVPSKSNGFIYPNNLRIADLMELKPKKLYV